MKIANYFPISTTHYSSTLSLNIRRTKGWAGYGQYIAILQMLVNSKTRKLSIEEIPDIAFNLHISEEDAQKIIQSYFVTEGQEFYSVELEEALSFFDAKYNASSNGGKKASANMTPEERLDRSRKANEAKGRKSNQLGNDLSSKVNDSATEVTTENNSIDQGTKETNLSDNLSTKEIPNNKIEEDRIEKNKIENEKKEQKIEEKLIKENKTEQVFKFSLEDENLKSIYFGDSLNKKLVSEYFSLSNELKSKLITYHQFELLLIIIIGNILSKKHNTKVLNRDMFITILNSEFEITIQSSLEKINDNLIQKIKDNEAGYIERLQFLRL